MITRSQLEFILDDTVVYCAVLTVICVMSFGLGIVIGVIWSVLL
jgi:MFS superfamily sulfate permease-like transporter